MADTNPYGDDPEVNPEDYGDEAMDCPTVGSTNGSDHNSSSTPAVGGRQGSEHNSPGATGNVY